MVWMPTIAAAGMLLACVAAAAADAPVEIRACLWAVMGSQPPDDMSRQDIEDLLVKLRKSELRKTSCGKKLLAYYAEPIR